MRKIVGEREQYKPSFVCLIQRTTYNFDIQLYFPVYFQINKILLEISHFNALQLTLVH